MYCLNTTAKSNIEIFIPGKCNNNCYYCYNKHFIDIKKSLEVDYIKMLDILTSHPLFESISFLGVGEPLLNLKDLVYVMNRYKKHTINIFTNGTQPTFKAENTYFFRSCSFEGKSCHSFPNKDDDFFQTNILVSLDTEIPKEAIQYTNNPRYDFRLLNGQCKGSYEGSKLEKSLKKYPELFFSVFNPFFLVFRTENLNDSLKLFCFKSFNSDFSTIFNGNLLESLYLYNNEFMFYQSKLEEKVNDVCRIFSEVRQKIVRENPNSLISYNIKAMDTFYKELTEIEKTKTFEDYEERNIVVEFVPGNKNIKYIESLIFKLTKSLTIYTFPLFSIIVGDGNFNLKDKIKTKGLEANILLEWLRKNYATAQKTTIKL